MEYSHSPVMPEEIIEKLRLKPGNTYIDCTLGGCGHAAMILEKTAPDGKLIGIDQDLTAIENARDVLSKYSERISLYHSNFSDIKEVLYKNKIEKISGIIADLGVSSHHLDNDQRGFSFLKEGPLDMRMDKSSGFSARDIVNDYSSEELFNIFKKYGEEKFASRIANRIDKQRKQGEINSTLELAEIIKSAIPDKFSKTMKIHPATKCFMAIRIEVNNELKALEKFLDNAPYLLEPEARLCVFTFHSLEDRIVKHRFRDLCTDCVCPPGLPVCGCGRVSEFRLVARKPLLPSEQEKEKNPRARSTKLRVLEKI
ncbi:MAG: 16S rRNA (cytosine(1402)-N(4))-methyltransferase RsmH [Thermodesulfobacteriota bacterium]